MMQSKLSMFLSNRVFFMAKYSFGIRVATTIMMANLFAVGSLAQKETVIEGNALEESTTEDDKALSAARERKTPQIRFDSTSMDFGMVSRGQKLSHTFRFSNVGKAPLVIHGVHAPCGCTVADVNTAKSYQPGDSGVVEVAFDTTDFSGPVTKIVTVMTNEKHLPDRNITLRATVVPEFKIDPPLADFGDVIVGKGAETSLIITPASGFSPVFEKLRFDAENLDANIIQDGSKWTLSIKLKPAARTGFYKSTLFAMNNSKSLPELPIPIRASVKGPIEFTPRYLEFGTVTQTESQKRSLTLRGTQDFNINSTRVELNVNGDRVKDSAGAIKVEVVPSDVQKKVVSIEVLNNLKKIGSVHGRIFLETSDAAQKEIAVVFYAFFK